MEAKPVVTTWCTLVSIAESFQSTQIEQLLSESKPEDTLEHYCCNPTATECLAPGIKSELLQSKFLNLFVVLMLTPQCQLFCSFYSLLLLCIPD